MVKSKRKDIFDHYQYIFWDFDGVIKDSVLLKSDAFEQLFLNFGDLNGQKFNINWFVSQKLGRL